MVVRANDPDNRTGGKERRVKERNVGGTVGIQLEIFCRLRAWRFNRHTCGTLFLAGLRFGSADLSVYQKMKRVPCSYNG